MGSRKAIRIAGVWALVLASALGARGAGAQPSSPDDTVTTEARRLYLEGVAAYSAGRYAEAERAFARVHQLKPLELEVLRNLGSAEVRAGNLVRGARHLARWLRESAKGSTEERAAVTDLLREAEAKVGRLRIQLDTPGAEVTIDGELIGQASIDHEVHVDPGEHVVVARSSGQHATVTTMAPLGAVTVVSLKLVRPTPPPPPRRPVAADRKPGTTLRSAGPSARVANILIVGGGATFAAVGVGLSYFNAASRSDDSKERLLDLIDAKYAAQPCGSECDGFDAAREESTRHENVGIASLALGIGAAGGTALALVLSAGDGQADDAGRNASPLLVGAIVTGVGIASGVAFTLAASSASSEHRAIASELSRSSCSPTNPNPDIARCAELLTALRDHDRNMDLAYVGFALAGSAAIGTAAYWLWPGSTTPANIRAQASAGGVALTLVGGF